MAGYEEVARISAVVEANIAPFERALTKGESSAKAFAAKTEASMEKAERSVKEFGHASTAATSRASAAHATHAASFSKSASQIDSQMQGLGRKASGFGKAMAVSLGFAGGYGFARLVGGVISTGAAFDAQMSRVRAVSGSTQAQFDALRGSAIKLGAQSVFSATEAAQGMEILGAAGLKSSQIIKAMPGLLDGAAASGEDFAGTASILTASLGAFNMKAEASTHIMDVLAAAAMASDASISDIGESLKYSAPVAKAFNMSIEESASLLTVFAQNGIKGSQAGTAMRASLLQLVDGRGTSAKELRKLNVEVADTSGKLKPFARIVDEVGGKWAGMGEKARLASASALFGQEAAPAMIAAISKGGVALDKLTKGFENADGAAHRMATTMTDNLAGDVEQLKGALESAAIAVSDAFRPQLRRQVARFQVYVNSAEFEQDAKAIVGAVVNIGEAMADTAAFVYRHKDAIVALTGAYVGLRMASAGAALLGSLAGGVGRGAAVAAVGRGAGLAGAAAGAGSAAAGALPTLARFAVVAGTAARAMTWIGAATIAGQVLYSLAKGGDSAGESAEEAAGRIADLQAKIDALKPKTVEVVVKTTTKDGSGKSKSPKAAGGLPRADAVEVGIENRDVFVGAEREAEKAADRVTAAIERQKDARKKKAYATGSMTKLEAQYEQEVQTMMDSGLSRMQAEQHPAVQGIADQWKKAKESAADATRAFADSNSELKKSEANAEAAGRVVQSAYRKMAGIGKGVGGGAAQSMVESMTEAARFAVFGTTSVNNALKKMGYVRVSGRWYDSLSQQTAMGKAIAADTKAKTNAILSGVGAVFASRDWVTSFASDLASARANASNGITIRVQQQIVPGAKPGGSLEGGKDGNPATPWATGGFVRGRGTGTSDDVPAWLSNGEYVIRAASVEKYGDGFLDAVNSGTLPKFAKGGKVKQTPREKAGNRWSSLSDSQSLAEAKADALLAKAERTPKNKMDDIKALGAIARQQEHAAKVYRNFQSGIGKGNKLGKNPLYSFLGAGEKASVQQAINSAMRAAQDARGRAAELGGPKKGSAAAATSELEALQERYGIDFAQLDAELAAAEGTAGFGDDADVLTRIAAKYGMQEGSLRALLPKLKGRDLETANSAIAGAIRGAADANKRIREGSETSLSEDERAQLDQANERARVAAENSRISEAALGVFSGANDIGYGGGMNAFGSAAGQRPMVVNVNALSGYDPAVKSAVASAADGGFSQGGPADKLYTGRA